MKNSTVFHSTKKLDSFTETLRQKGIDYKIWDHYNTNGWQEKLIGIPSVSGVYHWFKWYSKGEIETINFDHTHSDNTGKTKRGQTYRYKMTELFEKKLGIQLFIHSVK